ncbi:MAG: hypothetical protein II802_04270, partial [Clostridia bacterium]|nr:hypothetical protein [Clostridia bacterium]
MTLTTSSRNKATFGISGFTMKKNIGIIILTTVFMLLICPGYIFLSNERTDIFRNMRIFTDYVGTSITSVAILMSIISIFACFVNFSYLYSKKSVDVYHALPITRTRLLLARYFSAVIPLILPLLLCYGSLMAIVLINRVYACVSMILIGFAFAVAIMFM